jgi:hypothetical protein
MVPAVSARPVLVFGSVPGRYFTGCGPSKALIEAAARGASFTEGIAAVHQAVATIARTETAEVLQAEEFFGFVALIRNDGVVKPWPADSATPRYHHTYLELDGWDYWSMGEPIPKTTVINRALITQPEPP